MFSPDQSTEAGVTGSDLGFRALRRLSAGVFPRSEDSWSLCGEEEGKNVAEAIGPGVFVVQAALYALVDEVLAGLPTPFDKNAEEQIGIAKMVSALRGADVEPDRQIGFD